MALLSNDELEALQANILEAEGSAAQRRLMAELLIDVSTRTSGIVTSLGTIAPTVTQAATASLGISQVIGPIVPPQTPVPTPPTTMNEAFVNFGMIVSGMSITVGSVSTAVTNTGSTVNSIDSATAKIDTNVSGLIGTAAAIGDGVAYMIATVPQVHSDLRRLSEHQFETFRGLVEVLDEMRGFMLECRANFAQSSTDLGKHTELVTANFARQDQHFTRLERHMSELGARVAASAEPQMHRPAAQKK